MKKEVFNFLADYSTDPFSVDKLIVSAYLSTNNLKVINNLFLKTYIIKDIEIDEYTALKKFTWYFESESINFNLETLIELFEFVVSPSDKVVNGAIYTPFYIRDYIVKEAFKRSKISIDNVKSCDISCGCGGFLLTISNHIYQKTKKTFLEIYKDNIFGLDITEYSINRSKILLAILALEYGEDADFNFNIQIGNALTYNWKNEFVEIKKNNGFDVIVGNPPYVASRNMEDDTRNLMSNWSVSKTGHPDLYIPFFQIGYEALAPGGLLGYITVNTFMKSINGRALRDYFSKNQVSLKIINFGGEQVFKGRNTYTCICLIIKIEGFISYFRTNSSKLSDLKTSDFFTISYSVLNNKDGWNLVNTKALEEFVQKIECTGKLFKNLYITKNGIATLKNDVYKFTPFQEDGEFYYLKDGDVKFPIEKKICRDIINANKIKTEIDLQNKVEKIIFPYLIKDGKTLIIHQAEFQNVYPMAYGYLLTKKKILATRDKGKREYEEWYAFGRRQSMDINAYKLFFPHICERPNFVISDNKDLLFYNGIAIIGNKMEDLLTLQRILESDVFFNYIRATTKDYSSGYISMSRNFLKNFGVYQLNEIEKISLLKSEDSNSYVSKLYQYQKL